MSYHFSPHTAPNIAAPPNPIWRSHLTLSGVTPPKATTFSSIMLCAAACYNTSSVKAE